MIKFSKVHEDKTLDDILKDIINLLKNTNSYNDDKITYHKYGWPKEIAINKIDAKFLTTLTDTEAAGILIKMLFYVDVDLENNLLEWIRFHYIEIDGIKNSFDDLYFLTGMLYTLDNELILKESKLRNYHIGRFMDNFIFRIDQKYNWAVIYKFKDTDHKSYTITDHKDDLKKIRTDFKLSNAKIVKDSLLKSVLLIPHISNDDMLLLRMSLDNNHKIFSYATMRKMLEADDNSSSKFF